MSELIKSIVVIADLCHDVKDNNTVCRKCIVSYKTLPSCVNCLFNGFKHSPYQSPKRTYVLNTTNILRNRKQS